MGWMAFTLKLCFLFGPSSVTCDIYLGVEGVRDDGGCREKRSLWKWSPSKAGLVMIPVLLHTTDKPNNG